MGQRDNVESAPMVRLSLMVPVGLSFISVMGGALSAEQMVAVMVDLCCEAKPEVHG